MSRYYVLCLPPVVAAAAVSAATPPAGYTSQLISASFCLALPSCVGGTITSYLVSPKGKFLYVVAEDKVGSYFLCFSLLSALHGCPYSDSVTFACPPRTSFSLVFPSTPFLNPHPSCNIYLLAGNVLLRCFLGSSQARHQIAQERSTRCGPLRFISAQASSPSVSPAHKCSASPASHLRTW